MTLVELQAAYKRSYRTIQRERFMRQQVFARQPGKLAEKMQEMDQLMADVTAMKDELKRRLVPMEQPPLIDVPPSRVEYP